MKEYKIVNPKLGLVNRNEKLEELLNQFARAGWEVTFIHQNLTMIVLERKKNT
ncbi:MAG: DUF4177 domain-containing protein [Flavobacteriaceae bacterium]|nr:DUF4177 domain-containing protein [Flavobacteriaceae bacterium]MCB0474482.1 DUF4177 domain-containing protein [Flavobacteriaceae bacterium]